MTTNYQTDDQKGRDLFKIFCNQQPSFEFNKQAKKEFAKWDVSYFIEKQGYIGEIKVRNYNSTDFDEWYIQGDKLEALQDLQKKNPESRVTYINIFNNDKILIWDVTDLCLETTPFSIQRLQKNDYTTEQVYKKVYKLHHNNAKKYKTKKDMETTKEWLQSLNDDQVTEDDANQMMVELAIELAIAEATPKQLAPEIEAVRRALDNAKNNPTVTQNNPREFNYQTYLSSDEKAKQIMTEYLLNKGFVITEDKERYTTDILATKDGAEQGFEVEMSSLSFNKENFKYDNVSFLARKEKYRTNGEFNYIIISADGQYALTAKSQDIFNKENYMTKYAGNGRDGVDEFYQLPKNQVKFFKISLTK